MLSTKEVKTKGYEVSKYMFYKQVFKHKSYKLVKWTLEKRTRSLEENIAAINRTRILRIFI